MFFVLIKRDKKTCLEATQKWHSGELQSAKYEGIKLKREIEREMNTTNCIQFKRENQQLKE